MLGMSFSLRILVVCHCFREDDKVIRIISARKADNGDEGAQVPDHGGTSATPGWSGVFAAIASLSPLPAGFGGGDGVRSEREVRTAECGVWSWEMKNPAISGLPIGGKTCIVAAKRGYMSVTQHVR